MLKPLGGRGRLRHLFVTPEEAEAMKIRLADAGIAPGDVVIGVNPGARPARRASEAVLPERYAEVVSSPGERIRKPGCEARSRGDSRRKEETAGEIHRSTDRGRPHRRQCSGADDGLEPSARQTLPTLATRRYRPMHVAAAFDVPLVAVFGPTDWQATSPYRVAAQLRCSSSSPAPPACCGNVR
ncbi:MAG: glycosyltransferase family 9 protein [Nitrospiraceae bacterium]